MHDMYWYNISKHKPNLYNIICIYISLSLSLWTKPMRLCIIHMIDLLFVCINQKHLQEISRSSPAQGKIKASRFGVLPAANWFGIPTNHLGGLELDGFEIQWVQPPLHFFWGYPKKWDRNRFTNREIWSTRTKTWVGFCEVPKFKPWGKWFERSDRPRTGRRLNGPPSTLTMWGVMVVSLSPNFPKFTVNDSFK